MQAKRKPLQVIRKSSAMLGAYGCAAVRSGAFGLGQNADTMQTGADRPCRNEQKGSKEVMTTKYLKTTGINLYTINGETFCKGIDVIKMIHHEALETDDKKVRDILDRMEARVMKNNILIEGRKEPVKLTVENMPEEKQEEVPGRYALGFYDKNGVWHFYVESVGGEAIYTKKPCKAKLYKAYKDAECCADFLDEDVTVLDWEENMTEEERWLRALRMPMPYDWDEGSEDAEVVVVVREGK